MKEEKENDETTMKYSEKMSKNTLPVEERKFSSCSGGLKDNSAEVEELKSLDGDELPLHISLSVQRYEGETIEGHFHGEGLACFEGGHKYKGTFRKGIMEGRGVFMWAGGLKYEGEFFCNQPMGNGIYTWPDGSSYTGEVHIGIRQGTGTYISANSGVTYTGQWVQGKRHGKGEVYYNQEKTSWYRGDWVRNNREGYGVRCYPSGNTYSGEWKNNLRHGEGTMRWPQRLEEYVGMWQNGVQHGQGTHTWTLRRADRSQLSQRNQYTGDFVQAQRHGRGTFYYACGAIYDGEWRNNKKHGKGKFTYKDGRVFEGKFVDDQMMTDNLNGKRAETPFCGVTPLCCDAGSSVFGADMALNIESLLDKIPERNRHTEKKQVYFVVLRLITELRSLYNFYSSLGHTRSAVKPSLLSRLQLWRLLKDCYSHHHGITLTHVDRLIRGTAKEELHSPFTPILLRGFISSLVILAYDIYHKDMASQKNLLAACFSKLMTDDILPNAKTVKGFLFRQPDCAAAALTYLQKCWEVFQAFCKVFAHPGDDQTMTCRHLLWMFKDLSLFDKNLTTARLLEIITSESCDSSNWSSCLDVEITFLEFFEVLLGSADVKCHQMCASLQEERKPSPDTESRGDITERGKSLEPPTAQDTEKKVHSEEPSGWKGHEVQTPRVEVKHGEPELWMQKMNQFFYHFFFPTYERFQLVSKNMKENTIHKYIIEAVQRDG